ncbi:MAG: polysaccharide deacetylase family protein [Corallococcus sp.]|nr:polysaccharide deacetylase family protein [Corallococcus sp.]
MKTKSVTLGLIFICIFMMSAYACTAVFADTTNKEIALPILMYHSVLKSKTGTYIVSPNQIEQDLQQLISLGYQSITVKQLVDYVDGSGTLPPKPIMLTFDDGHYNNLYYALPILEKYGFCAVLNIIGKFSDYTTTSGDKDNPNYSHVTWDEVAELSRGNVMEIGNHSYNMHNYKPRFGMAKRSDETEKQYVSALKNDIGKLQSIIFEYTHNRCIALAYPFGKYNQTTENVLKQMGFRVTFTCNEGVNKIRKGDRQCLYKLKRINRSGLYNTDTVISKITKS